jgi:hypothetical protein
MNGRKKPLIVIAKPGLAIHRPAPLVGGAWMHGVSPRMTSQRLVIG